MIEPARKTWKKRLLALGLALLAALSVLEIAARIEAGAPLSERLPILMIRAHPTRGWEMLPSLEHYTYEHRVHVNELGLRGAEIGAKQAGELRVLVLGDSLVYGQGVADEETLPRQLERFLGERDPEGRRWSVVNGGLRAYDTNQELALLEELGARIAPDAVVLCWFWNDFIEHDVPHACATLTESGPVSFDTGGDLCGADWWRWQGTQLLRRSALIMLAHDGWRSATSTFLTPQTIEDGYGKLASYGQRFAHDCATLGAQPVFAAVPDANSLLASHPSAELAERALEIAGKQGLGSVALLEPLQALARVNGALPVLPFDGHYTSAGNGAMAGALARALLERVFGR